MKKILLILILCMPVAGLTLHASVFDDIALAKQINNCTLLSTDLAATTIPFTIEQGWIIITMEITNGQAAPRKEKFILDTGAPTLFTENFARDNAMQINAINLKATTPAAGQEAAQQYYTTGQPTLLKVGDMRLQQDHILVTRINMPSLNCINARGLIGSSLLSQFIVSIDFSSNTLTLSNKDKFDYKSITGNVRKTRLSPQILQKKPQSYLTINGEEYKAIWDTGFPGSVLLQYGTKDKDKAGKIAAEAGTKTIETFAAIGDLTGMLQETIMVYGQKNVAVKNEVDEIMTAPYTLQCSNENIKSAQMYVGLDFMRVYAKVIFDWKKNDLYLVNPQSAAVADARNNFARIFNSNIQVCYTDKKKFEVLSIDTRDPLYQKGVRAGDEVISVNGKALSAMDTTRPCILSQEMEALSRQIQAIVVKRKDQSISIQL